jgi:hypothetical protein
MSGWSVVLLWITVSGVPLCHAQAVNDTLPDAPSQQNLDDREARPSSLPEAPRAASSRSPMGDFSTHWLRGSAVPPNKELEPLTNEERFRLYLRQTFFNPGTYVKRLVGAGFDQARDVPHLWGEGGEAFGKRFASRYGQFVIQNTLKSAGDAAVGYEPRYDLCRCQGFWPRTKHAIVRNFVTYDSSEQDLRPQLPLYGAAFVAGAVSSTWKPGPRNALTEGSYAVASQAGWGILSNWLSEFSGDIGRKFSRKH